MPVCDVCQNSNAALHYTIKRFHAPFTVYRCPDCGHMFMHPRPENPEELYGPDYFQDSPEERGDYTYTDERKRPEAFAAVNRKRIAVLKKALGDAFFPEARFLDIGCSFGALLDEAARAGFTAAGMDISQYAVDYLLKQGIDAVQGSPEEANTFPGRALVVSMIEVIEHLESPARALENIYRELLPGGLLLIQTANMAGRQARRAGSEYHYFLPGHLHYFSRANLERLLRQQGFTHIQTWYPCEFGLLPKLIKSASTFEKASEYLKWLGTGWYHLKSKVHWKEFALTSGMVLYARKPSS